MSIIPLLSKAGVYIYVSLVSFLIISNHLCGILASSLALFWLDLTRVTSTNKLYSLISSITVWSLLLTSISHFQLCVYINLTSQGIGEPVICRQGVCLWVNHSSQPVNSQFDTIQHSNKLYQICCASLEGNVIQLSYQLHETMLALHLMTLIVTWSYLYTKR